MGYFLEVKLKSWPSLTWRNDMYSVYRMSPGRVVGGYAGCMIVHNIFTFATFVYSCDLNI